MIHVDPDIVTNETEDEDDEDTLLSQMVQLKADDHMIDYKSSSMEENSQDFEGNESEDCDEFECEEMDEYDEEVDDGEDNDDDDGKNGDGELQIAAEESSNNE